jgi:hypothetical protein
MTPFTGRQKREKCLPCAISEGQGERTQNSELRTQNSGGGSDGVMEWNDGVVAIVSVPPLQPL